MKDIQSYLLVEVCQNKESSMRWEIICISKVIILIILANNKITKKVEDICCQKRW